MYTLENNISTIKEGTRIASNWFYKNLNIWQVHIERNANIGVINNEGVVTASAFVAPPPSYPQ